MAPTNLEGEQAAKGRGDTSPSFVNKPQVADEGLVVDFKVLLVMDLAAMLSSEIGVLVREEVTDGIMDSF